MDTPVVEPKTTDADTADSSTEASPELPAPLLKIPVVQAMLAGTPPAVSGTIKSLEKNPDAKIIAKFKDDLVKAGFGFYKSLSGELGVIFNQVHIHPEDIQAADKAGKLTVLAPPFEQVDHFVSKAGLAHPALGTQQIPGGFKPPTPVPATAMPDTAQSTPASPQRGLMRQRVMNLQPGAPTSGPAPGLGRLTNQILTPAV